MSSWKPKYGGESTFKKKNHFKLKDGDVIARILPQPKGKDEDYSPNWSKFHSVIFGYRNSDGKPRPFESCLVKDNKTKPPTVTVTDPALDRLNDLKDKLEKARAEGNAPLMASLNSLVGFKGVYNVDNNHHMNVMLLDGSIGELKLRHKAKLDLDREMKALRDQEIDPLSFEDGRFFRFTRSGMGNETSFKVSVYKEKIEVPGFGKVDKDVVSKVGKDILSRLETEAFNLEDLFSRPTQAEVAQIVLDSDLRTGKSPACDRIFDARWKAKRDANKAVPESQDDNVSTDNYQEPVASFKAPQTSAPVPVQAKVEAPKAQVKSLDELPDDEFFEALGVKNTAQG